MENIHPIMETKADITVDTDEMTTAIVECLHVQLRRFYHIVQDLGTMPNAVNREVSACARDIAHAIAMLDKTK